MDFNSDVLIRSIYVSLDSLTSSFVGLKNKKGFFNVSLSVSALIPD